MINQPVYDVIVIGAGPAGLSAALWVTEMGHTCLVLDKARRMLNTLHDLNFNQNWVIGFPGKSLKEVGDLFAGHIKNSRKIKILLNRGITSLEKRKSQFLALDHSGNRHAGRVIIIATGLVTNRPLDFFSHFGVLDAVELTQQRDVLIPGKTLIIGGGDNALENAIYLKKRRHDVTLWCRGRIRGRSKFEQEARELNVLIRDCQPLPSVLHANRRYEVQSEKFGNEYFTNLCALLGYRQEKLPIEWFNSESTIPEGVFLAGDYSLKWHPCVHTAVADGTQAAVQSVEFLKNTSN